MCKEMGEYYGLQWGCRCCGNGDGRDAGLGGRAFWRVARPWRTPTFASMSSFSLFLFVNHQCAKKWGYITVCNGLHYGLQWGYRCCGNGDGRDGRMGSAPFGALPSLGERQRSLLCLLFHCSCLLTICAQRNEGCTVCIVRVVCSAGRRTELRLLKIHQLSFLVGTSIDLDAIEQRQDTKTGVFQAIKRSQ